MPKKIDFKKIDCIFFDFDGVLTNNKVFIDQNGMESVICSRSDGLYIKILKKIIKHVFIISTEKNKVVSMRGNKIKIPVKQNILSKENEIKKIAKQRNISLKKSIFIGNDINDLDAMLICGVSMCPSDSNPQIKKISNYKLKTKGGDGIVYEILNDIFKVDLSKFI
tara:strand:- start:1659 stop:2156 length:498 start_codon:yes stop_codon:yes gene_type:complete